LKGRKTATESTTAGAAKVSSVTARSKSELKELGDRMGWAPRKLSMAEIRELSSQELLWREQFDAENLKAALELPARLAQGKEIDSQWKAHRFWNDTASPEEYKTLLNEFKKFLDHYPQYRTTTTHFDENNDVLFAWLQDRHMSPIYSNLVLAFEATALEGRLWLNPSAIAAGSESETFGTHHHNFHLLIQPQRRNADDRLSAKDYLAQHKELHDTRVPAVILQAWNKAMATFVSMHPEFVNTPEAREKIFAALRSRKMNVTLQSIEEVFLHFAKSGEVQIDGSKTVEGQAVRLTDLGGRTYRS
jgi:hypothetical protein